MKRYLLLVLLFAASCSTAPAGEDTDKRFAAYASERQMYMACANLYGTLISQKKPTADPAYIAIAAREQCGDERSKLLDAIKRAHNPEIWMRILRIYDRKFDEHVISIAVSQ